MNSIKNIILMITYYQFPCNEPALDGIFSKEIGLNHDLIWLFQGDTSHGKIATWEQLNGITSKANSENRYYF